MAQKVKEYDYQKDIDSIKKNKGKIKKSLIIVGIVIAVIAIFAGIFKMHKAMSRTPEDAIDNYFNAIEKSISVSSMVDRASEDSAAEVAEAFVNSIDYKILAIDENGDTANVILEVKVMDLEAVYKETTKELENKKDASQEETDEIILNAIKNNDETVKDTITIELVKNDKKWTVSSDLMELLLNTAQKQGK